MIFYGLKNCDACKLLLKSQPHFKLIDVSLTPVPDDILMEAIAKFGDTLVNKRSTTWRSLDSKTRKKKPEEIIKLHPKAMKRPLIKLETGELTLGFQEKNK